MTVGWSMGWIEESFSVTNFPLCLPCVESTYACVLMDWWLRRFCMGQRWSLSESQCRRRQEFQRWEVGHQRGLVNRNAVDFYCQNGIEMAK